jgi:cytoskeletal protein RodZ
MGSVASELKSEREKRKISLAQIAADTHISLRHLESLEEGRFGDLPGGMYNRAFLRAYCATLNLDQQEIIQRYEEEVSSFPGKPPKFKVQIPAQDSRLKPSPLVIWSLTLLVSATGLFFSRRWITAVFSPYFYHTPARTVRFEPKPQPAGNFPAPADSSIAAHAVFSPTPSQKNSTPAESALSSHAPASPLQLEISVTEKCWVSVERDGALAFRKLMEPGEAQSLNASEEFLLIIGNAGSVHLKINGKPVKPLGKQGEVIKFLINTRNMLDLIDQTVG